MLVKFARPIQVLLVILPFDLVLQLRQGFLVPWLPIVQLRSRCQQHLCSLLIPLAKSLVSFSNMII